MSSRASQTIEVSAPIQPRLTTKAGAAAYCAITPHAYDRHRRAGRLPGYLPGTHRIDLRAVDAALDALSRLGGLPPRQVPEEEIDLLAEFNRRRAERKARKIEMLSKVEVHKMPRRGGGVATTYYHRASGQRLPNNPRSLAFEVAFERCEQDLIRGKKT